MPKLTDHLYNYFQYGIVGRSLRIDASSMCQLDCTLCRRSLIEKGVGQGHLTLACFKGFVDTHRSFDFIELSNYGEIFLNPDLAKIVEYACCKNIALAALNGVNLNHASEDVLESLVRYRFGALSVSIDGASDETYKIYRRKGCFDRVIENVRRINFYKTRYKSQNPKLIWQFVVFDHNKHEIERARAMAKELSMEFILRPNWEDFCPSGEKKGCERKEAQNVLTAPPASEPLELLLQNRHCHQFWTSPQINWDGKLLGCCMNMWTDFGNVFESGLKSCLKSEKYVSVIDLVTGRQKNSEGLPCAKCPLFAEMKRRNIFFSPHSVLFKFLKELISV